MTVQASNAVDGVVRRARTVLLDFDGPVCSVFVGQPAPATAARLLDQLGRTGVTMRAEWATEKDPLALLRSAAAACPPRVVSGLARSLEAAELTAVESAVPTADADVVLRALWATGRRTAIVSNNSTAAVVKYLRLHGLADLVVDVVGRSEGMDVERLKPHPHLVELALMRTMTDSAGAVMVGDSPADAHAAQAVNVACIGLASKPQKRAQLLRAGAVAVVDSMSELAEAIRRVNE